ncbi:MAG TPA: hypothetical protein VNL77_11125, partial [Roseiflexaceae bacterium]|nr:hypothetical protein [Roseiflexaceae bacterium]
FRGLSRTIVETVRPPYLVLDGRRMIPDYDELVAAGYGYLAVGSPYLPPFTQPSGSEIGVDLAHLEAALQD